MEDNTNFYNLSVVEVFKQYNDKLSFKDNATLNEMQSNYDHCTEILETVTLREVELLWTLRRLPFFINTIIEKFITDNYAWWKQNDNFKKINELIRFGKPSDNK